MDKSAEQASPTERTVELLTQLRMHGPMTRSEIGTATGWARPTVNKHIDELIAMRLARPLAMPSATGGRPAQGFAFDATGAHILAIDIATTATTIALCDLNGQPAAMRTIDVGAENDPGEALARIDAASDAIIAETTADADGRPTRICATSVAVTTRVETATGAIIQAPVMRHWEHHDLRDHFATRHHAPAFIENDANARALCKAYQLADGQDAAPAPGQGGTGTRKIADLLYVHAGMGLGAGIVADGAIMHGAIGGAGDIGHIHVFGDTGADAPCRCGNIGCVEATAGGWAILQTLRERGRDVRNLDDVAGLATHGDIEAVQLVRRAGRLIGDVISACVNLLNPSCIVVGGELVHCGDLLMPGIRERVWARASSLAATSLRIESCSDEARAGVVGLAHAAIDQGLTSLDFLRGFATAH